MKKLYQTPQFEVQQLTAEKIMYPKQGSPGGGGKPQPAPGRGEGSSVKLTKMYI